MLNKLIEYMDEAKKCSTEEKLKLFLSISEKIMAMLIALHSQNSMLEERVKRLEYLNKPAPPLPPLPPTTGIRENPHSSMMTELKELFERKKNLGKDRGKK